MVLLVVPVAPVLCQLRTVPKVKLEEWRCFQKRLAVDTQVMN